MEIKNILTIDNQLKKELIELLIESVETGDLGFDVSLPYEYAEKYWNKIQDDLKTNIETNEITRVLLVLFIENQVAGTIQLGWGSKIYTNQHHRADVNKLMVANKFRGKGVAKQLLNHIELIGRQHNKQLLILDTRTDHPISPKLYSKHGYIEVGEIPFYSLDSINGYTSTTYFYKIIDENLKKKN